MLLGGEMPVVDAAKARGLPVGYGTMWIGKWNSISPDGSLPDARAHIAACEQRGVTPYFHLYVLAGGLKSTSDFAPLYQYAGALEQTVGGTRRAVVSIEPEWNENDIPANPATFDMAFQKTAAILHVSPGISVMSCLGGWDSGYGGAGGTLARFPKMVASLDLSGVQCMRSLPRDTPTSYDAAAEKTITHLASIRRVTDKPLMVPDVALGTYGGNASSTYPWPGGDYAAEAQRQKRLLDAFVTRKADFDALGVKAFLYRELRDNRSRKPESNWYGYGEWSFGLQDKDGNPKPGMDSYFNLGTTPAPAPPAPPEDELARLRTFRDRVKSALADAGP